MVPLHKVSLFVWIFVPSGFFIWKCVQSTAKKFSALWYQIRLDNWSTLEVMFDDIGEWRGGMLQFRVGGLGWKTSKILIYICLIPSLNTQSCINGFLVVWDFCFWAVWVAAGPLLKKNLGWLWVWGRFFHVFSGKTYTVFPHILAAATILFWNLRCGNYSREETIQRRKLLINSKFHCILIMLKWKKSIKN